MNNIQIARDQRLANRIAELLAYNRAEKAQAEMVKEVSKATNSNEIYKSLKLK